MQPNALPGTAMTMLEGVFNSFELAQGQLSKPNSPCSGFASLPPVYRSRTQHTTVAVNPSDHPTQRAEHIVKV